MRTKQNLKDLIITFIAITVILVLSLIAYVLAYNYALPSEQVQSGLAALVSAFMLQIVGLMFYAASK